MEKDYRAEIDSMSLYDLLYIWRFAPSGDPRLQGERGEYHQKVMNLKRYDDPSGWVQASKRMGVGN